MDNKDLAQDFQNQFNDVVSRFQAKRFFQSEWDIVSFAVLFIFIGEWMLFTVHPKQQHIFFSGTQKWPTRMPLQHVPSLRRTSLSFLEIRFWVLWPPSFDSNVNLLFQHQHLSFKVINGFQMWLPRVRIWRCIHREQRGIHSYFLLDSFQKFAFFHDMCYLLSFSFMNPYVALKPL